MSSTYDILCMSHDPAVKAAVNAPSAPEASAAVFEIRRGELYAEHKNCDLLIGRYSYPLVEVCCPGRLGLAVHPGSTHSSDEWADVRWLRLLYAALSGPRDTASAAVAAALTSRCWSWERLHRLRFELGFDGEEAAA